MGINWFTLIAQIVNFLILAALLKRFLYGPVMDAMERREKRIADSMAQADAQRAEAAESAEKLRLELQDLDKRREDLLSEARQSANKRREALEKEAREEVASKRAKWLESLERERDSFVKEAGRRVLEQAEAASRRALKDLAGADLEERVLEVFLSRLDGLGGAEREGFAEAAGRQNGRVEVRSASGLSPEQESQVAAAVRALAGEGALVEFELAPEMIAGIELRASGAKLEWSIGDYLDGVAERVAETFGESGALDRSGKESGEPEAASADGGEKVGAAPAPAPEKAPRRPAKKASKRKGGGNAQ